MSQHPSSELLNGINVSEILNVQKIHDNLYSSGQPTVQQLELICQAGVSTVVNLALNDASNSLMREHIYEDRTVLELGMHYVHLPLLWDCPSASQALFALKAIHHLQDQLVWIHCAKNWRVSSLMYLYRRFYMKMPIEQADELLHQVWEPDETWTGLINAVAMQLQAEQFSY
ncbi:hypothetical protein BKE30_14855 [Alkanindiges hydrocarboniclasticus]|jgi:protein tyrosine phosphatase (PTP) superfamily phosphohydrolase (DUF442 family)|uniref:DSP-PTPase phosphatase fused to NAD+ Kinase domain-containing protein n=1 Tax=Alkanindiges hydrocarboniclasticus TaxID=1907941 RepID=A0A1S8CRI9_9GAMM|nr:protein tyrosine phosphatase family protein [Alkanindiges hydrocarboniclasticus]ONG37275.1 hypothetical protein BKE30_14855 [Alkanindiges hydrocarboniclasticus]